MGRRRKKLSLSLPGMLLATALFGCAGGAPPAPKSVRDQNTDFSAFGTFGWYAMPSVGDVDQPLRLLDQNIRDGIRNEMLRRGYTLDTERPDLLFAYETARETKVENAPVRVGMGVGGYSGGFGGSVNMSTPSVRNFQEGTLIIHAISAQSNAEVWQGKISGQVKGGTLEPAAVRNVVGLAMQDFPSRSGP
jgi:Domain of unknown function (DUF4136)